MKSEHMFECENLNVDEISARIRKLMDDKVISAYPLIILSVG